MKRTVFVSQVFYPDQQSTSQLFSDLFLALTTARDFEVVVASGYPAGARGEVEEDLPETLGKRIRIRRSGLRLNFKKNLFYRLAHYLAYMAGSSWQVLRNARRAKVFAVTNPPFTPVWIWGLSLLGRFRYDIMLHDIYPDGLTALGVMRESSVLAKIWRGLNRRALQRADRVVVLGRDMSDLIQSTYGVKAASIRYIPNWSSFVPREPVAAEDTKLFRAQELEGKFVVQYSGNMGLWHDMKAFVRAAKLLEDDPDVLFLLIGDGRRKAEAQALSRELGCQNVRWLPFQPKETLGDSLACCHLSLISQREGLEGIAVPCKIYGILASARGFIAAVPDKSEVAQVAREEQCGVVVSPSDPQAIADAIREVKASGAHREMGQEAFRAYREKYTLESAVEAFEEFFDLCKGGS